jgi:hypothetical protein
LGEFSFKFIVHCRAEARAAVADECRPFVIINLALDFGDGPNQLLA